MASAWANATNENVLEFIHLYRRERILWDPKHPQCRNRGEISEAWMRIQSNLSIGCPITDLKKKKESLMTSYRSHLHRKKKNPHYAPTWFAYNDMDAFLGEKYASDNTNELENEFFNPTEHSYSDDPISTHSVGVVVPERNNSRQVKKKKLYQSELPSTPITNTNASRNLDEYDLYGQLLATKLRKLDEQQRDMAMHEIDTIMFRAKMQGGSHRSYIKSSTPVPRKMKSPIFIVSQQNNVEYEDENIAYQEEHIQSEEPC